MRSQKSEVRSQNFRMRAPLLLVVLLLTAHCSLLTAFGQDTPLTNKFPPALNSQDSLGRTADGPSATLTSTINSSVTIFNITGAASRFPASGLSLLIENEIVLCTTRVSATFSGCLRGQKGTTAVGHNSGVAVRSPILSAQRDVLVADLLTIETKLGVGASSAASASVGHALIKQANGTTAWAAQSGAQGPTGPQGPPGQNGISVFCAGATDVVDYGADPTGVASSRNGFVAAYAAAVASNKRWCVPPGTYRFTAADVTAGHMTYITDPDIELFGSKGKSIIKLDDNITPANDSTVVYISGAKATVHGLTIQGTSLVSGTDSLRGFAVVNAKGAHLYDNEVFNLNDNTTAGAAAFSYESANSVSYKEISATTLGTTIASGVRTVTPASMSDIYPGRRLKIGGTTEYVVVTDTPSTTTFTATFANAHNAADAVTVLGEGEVYATFERNYVHDAYNGAGFSVNGQAGRFFNNRTIRVGLNPAKGQHHYYIQQGGNVFDSNWMEGAASNTPIMQEYLGGTGARDGTANKYTNNDFIGLRHFFSSGSQINDGGIIVAYPVNYSLQREQIFSGNHFKTPIGAGVVGDVALGARVIFANNYLENSAIQTSSGDAYTNAQIIGNTLLGINMPQSGWGILARDNAIVADNQLIDINTTSSIGNEAPIIIGANSSAHHNRIKGGNWFNGISVTGTNAHINDNTITGVTAGAVAPTQAIRIDGATDVDVHDNFIDGNSVLVKIGQWDTAIPTGKIYHNVFKNLALDGGRALASTLNWVGGLDFFENEIPQMGSVVRNSKKLAAMGGNVSVDVNQYELVGLDSNNRATDITIASTRFFGVFVGPNTFVGAATNNDALVLVVYEIGAECTVKADGAWVRGNVGIISTTAARKIHDTGAATPPATFDISYVIFLDSGGGAGNAKVRMIKGL